MNWKLIGLFAKVGAATALAAAFIIVCELAINKLFKLLGLE